MIQVVSTFESTSIVLAKTGGVYTVDAGSPLTLSALNTHPSASYAWDLGDGTTATGPSVTHTYADNGVYVARLTVVVNEPGGARTRHFARINALNVPPTVDAGSDMTFDEGEVIAFTGTFTDPEWPDTHEATWSWGDYQGPSAGTVVETNSPPSGGGSVEGSHAWGDNGTYQVTLTVRDDDGGVGEDALEVTVLNVPPVVDAGPELYAYPCTVITLTGYFKDQGWLDTHVASWEFGDCTPVQTALVEETNDPPAADGTATASHVYGGCGAFHAVCTVVDDDGGVGSAATVIRVVDVVNADFEHGFRQRLGGAVANGWEPYPDDAEDPKRDGGKGHVYAGEEILVHGGQRSQRIGAQRGGRAGILQQVGANPTWDYQASSWYSLDEGMAGTARLGIDPAGGTDPDAPSVVWTAPGNEHREWAQLAARVTATDRLITIFLEADAGDGAVDACFDDVELVPIQPFCPTEPPPPDDRCVDFTAYGPRAKLPPKFEEDGFDFASVDGDSQMVVPYGVPQGVPKLHFHVTGVDVRLPFRSSRVTVAVSNEGGKPVLVSAYDGNGNEVASADKPPYVLVAPGMRRLRVYGGSGEAALVRVCAEPDQEDQPSLKAWKARAG